MLRKAVLTTLVAMFVLFSVSMSYANQVDGMASGTGPVLPGGIQSSINPGGLGDSLLYGYYNVRGNLNLFNVINTSTTDGAKVRVIFRNAKNSVECLDFSVCLSIGDVWTAYLIDNGTTAAICPWDTDTATAPTLSSCVPFKYEGAGGIDGVTADDCREGYFEIVGMYGIPNFDHNTCTTSNTCPSDESTCRVYQSTNSVQNVLMGNNAIVETATLGTYSYNALAVADTSLFQVDLPSGRDLSIPFAMDNWCPEADYIFTKSNLISPYDLITEIGGETEIVVTFPTRYDCHYLISVDECDSMFGSETCCTPINMTLWNDQEKKIEIFDFSPLPTGRKLCNEVNVIKLGASDIMDSTVSYSVAEVGGTEFQLGWTNIDLYAGEISHETVYGSPQMTTKGLPAVAYTIQSFVGGEATYMLPTAYRTNIQ